VRESTKYEHVVAFADALPAIREKVQEHLALRDCRAKRYWRPSSTFWRPRSSASETTKYAERNNSYGLTTLQKRHVAVDGNEVGFRFPARASLGVRDRRIAKIIKACQELPGQELLQFVDEAGNCQDVTSTDVNDHAGKLGNTSTICHKCYVPRKC